MRLINQRASPPVQIMLAALPFIALIVIYSIASQIRLEANPADKLLPSFQSMGEAFWRLATQADQRSGNYLLWTDTFASLQRLAAGMGISAMLALFIGVPIGIIPKMRSLLATFIATLSLIPPITILPILFIVFGLGETSKIMLIVIGTALVMTRSVAQAASELPQEMIVKAQTLGASSWQLIVRIVVPQILPRLILAIRLGLVPAWIFLVSAEAIASTEGLGYRIFLVRRYLAMDVILPYVAWITLIAYLIDRALMTTSRWLFPWAHDRGGAM